MRINEVNLEALQKEVRRLAEANPQFVYQKKTFGGMTGMTFQGCSYTEETDDGKLVGSCIVGQAFINLGVDPEKMASREHVAIGDLLIADFDLDAEDPTLIWLRDVQENQDSSVPWGEAVEAADRTVEI